MKLRIKANSLRIRLTKTEVNRIASEDGYLEEQTSFGNTHFTKNKLLSAIPISPMPCNRFLPAMNYPHPLKEIK